MWVGLLGVALATPNDLLLVGDEGWVTVRDGRIHQIGPPRQPPKKNTRVLKAQRITAGMVDAHGHPGGLAARRARLDLTGLQTYAATLAKIGAEAGDGWLVGSGWDQNDWSDPPEGVWPRATDLDQHTERPAVLIRIDGHAAWLNTAALHASGITAETGDPAGGRILRDPDGEATGVLVDAAMDLVSIPAMPAPRQVEQLHDALESIAATGLTGVHAMGVSDGRLTNYEELEAAGKLPIRIWAYVRPDSDAARRLLAEGPFGAGYLRVVGIKAFADGALGSRGALLREPYSDEPGHSGLATTSEAELTQLATACLAVRAQLAVHAIGDLGVHHTLNAFAAARSAHPEAQDVPLRVEHAQVVHPDDQPRFAGLNAIASMQPTHATSDMPWAEARLGSERVDWSYAWRSLADAGATLAFGSDFPVESVDPGLGLWAAMTRQSLEGSPDGGWRPEHKLSAEQAIGYFTRGSALAVGESGLGTVEVGATADLTLWAITSSRGTDRYQAVATIVGGRVVWASEPGPPGEAPAAAPSPDK